MLTTNGVLLLLLHVTVIVGERAVHCSYIKSNASKLSDIFEMDWAQYDVI